MCCTLFVVLQFFKMGFELKILLHSFKVESKVSSVAQFSLCTVDAPLLHSPDVLWRTPRQGNLSGLRGGQFYTAQKLRRWALRTPPGVWVSSRQMFVYCYYNGSDWQPSTMWHPTKPIRSVDNTLYSYRNMRVKTLSTMFTLTVICRGNNRSRVCL